MLNLKSLMTDHDSANNKLLKKFLNKRSKQGVAIKLMDTPEETQSYAKKMSV